MNSVVAAVSLRCRPTNRWITAGRLDVTGMSVRAVRPACMPKHDVTHNRKHTLPVRKAWANAVTPRLCSNNVAVSKPGKTSQIVRLLLHAHRSIQPLAQSCPADINACKAARPRVVLAAHRRVQP